MWMASSCTGTRLAITTPRGVVIHTGDFKIDPTPIDGIPIDVRDVPEGRNLGVVSGGLIPCETLVAADDDRNQPDRAFLRHERQ